MPRVHTHGVDLEYWVEGDGPETILLVSGLALSMVYWEASFRERLVALGARVIAFDQRDCGRSSHLDHLRAPSLLHIGALIAGSERVRVPYPLRALADDALALLDHLGVARAHLVGFSMGGAVAQTLAIEDPHRVLSLTSLSSWCDVRSFFGARPAALRLLTTTMPTERAPRIEATIEAIRVLVANDARFDPARARSLAEQDYDHGFCDAGTRRQIGALWTSRRRTEALSTVRVPALVVHGDRDPLVPFEAGVATAGAIPGARFLPIEGLGHDIAPWAHDPIVGAISELIAHRPWVATPSVG